MLLSSPTSRLLQFSQQKHCSQLKKSRSQGKTTQYLPESCPETRRQTPGVRSNYNIPTVSRREKKEEKMGNSSLEKRSIRQFGSEQSPSPPFPSPLPPIPTYTQLIVFSQVPVVQHPPPPPPYISIAGVDDAEAWTYSCQILLSSPQSPSSSKLHV